MIGALARALRPKTTGGLGRAGEKLAARWLRRRGYRVLARNMHVGVGEADIVCLAPDKKTIVIVEVKTRRVRDGGGGFGPEVAVGGAKSRKLVQVAHAAMKAQGWHGRAVRIDVVAVMYPQRGRAIVRHHASAVTL